MRISDLRIVDVDEIEGKPYKLLRTKEFEFYYWFTDSDDSWIEAAEFEHSLQENIREMPQSELVRVGWQMPQLNEILSADIISLIKSEDIYYLLSYLQLNHNITTNTLGDLRTLEISGRKLLDDLRQEYNKFNGQINNILKVLIYEANSYAQELGEVGKAYFSDGYTVYDVVLNNYDGFQDHLFSLKSKVLVDIEEVENITRIPITDKKLKEKITPALILSFESRNQLVRDMLIRYENYLITLKAIEILESDPSIVVEAKKNPALKDLKPNYNDLFKLIHIQRPHKTYTTEFEGLIRYFIKKRRENSSASKLSIIRSYYENVLGKKDFSESDRKRADRWIVAFVNELKENYPSSDWSIFETKHDKNKLIRP